LSGGSGLVTVTVSLAGTPPAASAFVAVTASVALPARLSAATRCFVSVKRTMPIAPGATV
jgi:hypothetical protein